MTAIAGRPLRRRPLPWPAIRFWGGWVATALALAWLLNFAWWLLLEPLTAPTASTEIVIPPGTAAALEAGSATAFVPGAIAFPSGGGEVRVKNEDSVAHRVGPATVPPGAVAVIAVGRGETELTCTIHPSGYLGLELDARPGIDQTIVPALLTGVPAGLLIALSVFIARKLQVHPEEPSA